MLYELILNVVWKRRPDRGTHGTCEASGKPIRVLANVATTEWQKCLTEAAEYLGLELLDEADEALARIETEDRTRYGVLAIKFQVAAARKNWWVWDCSQGEPEKIDPAMAQWWIAAAQAARQARSNRDGEVILRMGLAMHENHPEILYHLARAVCGDDRHEEAARLLLFAVGFDARLYDRSQAEEDFRPIWEN